MRIPSFLALPALAALLAVVPVTVLAVDDPPAGAWQIHPARSVVEFTVTKLGFADVTGRFHDFAGSVRYDPTKPEESSVEWTVHVASVRTDAPSRDSSLLAPEYFDAARHPRLVFRSERVRPRADGRLDVDGTITMRGQARPLTIVVEPVNGGFESRFELDRYDFGIVGGSVMGRLIGRTVRIRLVALPAEGE